jgi:hypothetical protein
MSGDLTLYLMLQVPKAINLANLKFFTIIADVSHANQQKREIIYGGGVGDGMTTISQIKKELSFKKSKIKNNILRFSNKILN